MIDPEKLPAAAVEEANDSRLVGDFDREPRAVIAAFLEALLADDEAMQRAANVLIATSRVTEGIEGVDKRAPLMRAVLTAAVQESS